MNRNFFTILYLIPAVMALFGGLGHLSGGFYLVLKVLFVIDGAIHLWAFGQINKMIGDNPYRFLILGPVLAGIFSILSVFVSGGLPKALWVIVDVAYAVDKIVIILLLWKYRNENS